MWRPWFFDVLKIILILHFINYEFGNLNMLLSIFLKYDSFYFSMILS